MHICIHVCVHVITQHVYLYIFHDRLVHKVTSPHLSDERSKSFGQLGTAVLNELSAIDLSCAINTTLIILEGMTKRMAIGKKLEFVYRTIDKAQTVPYREMVLRQRKSFTGKLPQDGTLQIM